MACGACSTAEKILKFLLCQMPMHFQVQFFNFLTHWERKEEFPPPLLIILHAEREKLVPRLPDPIQMIYF